MSYGSNGGYFSPPCYHIIYQVPGTSDHDFCLSRVYLAWVIRWEVRFAEYRKLLHLLLFISFLYHHYRIFFVSRSSFYSFLFLTVSTVSPPFHTNMYDPEALGGLSGMHILKSGRGYCLYCKLPRSRQIPVQYWQNSKQFRIQKTLLLDMRIQNWKWVKDTDPTNCMGDLNFDLPVEPKIVTDIAALIR